MCGVTLCRLLFVALQVNPSHNTDGVDPDCSRHVLVEDSYISVGDGEYVIKNTYIATSALMKVSTLHNMKNNTAR